MHALFKVKQPVKEYLEKVFSYGVSHPCIVGEGDMAAELEIVADLLGIEKFRID